MVDPTKFTRESLLDRWRAAIKDETFLTAKHNVASVGSGSPEYRTVSMKTERELGDFFTSGRYGLRIYENEVRPLSPVYVVVTPDDARMVAGSGIQAHSHVPTVSCDRFVVVSGEKQGWHVFAEQDTAISEKVSSGKLRFLADL